jgi:hypothetical protein
MVRREMLRRLRSMGSRNSQPSAQQTVPTHPVVQRHTPDFPERRGGNGLSGPALGGAE